MPEPILTPEKLREIAWALDALTKIGMALIEPIAVLNTEAEVTIKLTENGEPMSKKDALRLLDWLNGDEMQNDLRALADQLEGNHA